MLFLQLYSDKTCIVIGLYCLSQHYDWPVVAESKERIKGSWKVPDTRKTKMVATGMFKQVEARGVKVSERCGITQWRSWSRLPKWMSAHEVDLKKFETHMF